MLVEVYRTLPLEHLPSRDDGAVDCDHYGKGIASTSNVRKALKLFHKTLANIAHDASHPHSFVLLPRLLRNDPGEMVETFGIVFVMINVMRATHVGKPP